MLMQGEGAGRRWADAGQASDTWRRRGGFRLEAPPSGQACSAHTAGVRHATHRTRGGRRCRSARRRPPRARTPPRARPRRRPCRHRRRPCRRMQLGQRRHRQRRPLVRRRRGDPSSVVQLRAAGPLRPLQRLRLQRRLRPAVQTRQRRHPAQIRSKGCQRRRAKPGETSNETVYRYSRL